MLVPNADSLGSFDFGAQQKIQKVFREAPMHGIHFVCHWQNPVAVSYTHLDVYKRQVLFQSFDGKDEPLVGTMAKHSAAGDPDNVCRLYTSLESPGLCRITHDVKNVGLDVWWQGFEER